MISIDVMILAAGLGTRLRPYSLLRPKPLFPVLDRPLLMLTIEQLRRAFSSGAVISDVRRDENLKPGSIVVNACHLADQITDLLNDQDGVFVQIEDKILGTGGGLGKAGASRFGSDPVLVTNGDIFHNIDYCDVYRHHCNSNHPVTMVLHDCPRFNNVSVTREGQILGFGALGEFGDPDETELLAFTGIHVINTEILKQIPPDSFYNIIDCYRELINRGETVHGLVVRDHLWTDMGTPQDYLELHGNLLTNPDLISKYLDPAMNSPLFVSPGAHIGENVNLNDWVSIGSGAKIGDNVSLTRVVVWDGAEVKQGTVLNDAIVV